MGRISNRLKGSVSGWSARYLRALDRLAQSMSIPTCAQDAQALVDAGYDPSHTLYLAVQNVLSVFAACIANQPELKRYVDAVSKAEDRYSPEGPPASGLTSSYFTAWSFFDLAVGPERETIGTCLVEVGELLAMDPAILEAVDRFSQSRMGVYEHCGASDGRIRLRELVTGRDLACVCPSGYAGKPGELWYVRLCAPREDVADGHVAVTTPYVLTGAGKADWVAYLHRTMLQLDAAQSKCRRLHDLLKFGLNDHHWHDFIAKAFDRHRDEVIFLRGLPDVQGSMPRSVGARGTRPI